MASDYFKNQTMQDPAVPMIQLPIKFKSRRTNTVTTPKTTPEAYHVDIFDVEGCGCVRHIWVLFADGRRLEITVDGAETPQVDMPLKSLLWYHARLDTLLCRQCSLHSPTQLRDTSDARQSGATTSGCPSPSIDLAGSGSTWIILPTGR